MPSTAGSEYWTTRGSTEPDRTPVWADLLSRTHLPWTVSLEDALPPGEVFDAWVRRWWIDDVALVDCECSPCSGARTRRQLAETDGEFVVVLINRSGRETVQQGETEALLGPGDAVVWDSTRPARFRVWEPLAKRSLLIPRAALQEVCGPAWLSGELVLSAGSPATQLLTSYLDVLSRSLSQLSPAAVTAARNATLQLLVGALRADHAVVSSAASHPALRAAMDRYIEAHLVDPLLSPAALANAHGVSVRTVNRVYNADGRTVGEVVRARRLARARTELAETDRSVVAIAHRWGFADASHFSRAFKAHYGSTPTDFRQGRVPAGGGVVASGPERGAQVHGSAAGRAETGVTTARR